MIYALADYDPTRFAAVLRWPVRDGLVAYVQRKRSDALTAFRHAQLVHVLAKLGGSKRSEPPAEPAILKSRFDD